MKRGYFITLEGPDGSGKTTNMKTLVEEFEALGYDVISSREPGGTPVGERIRELLLHEKMYGMTELLLFAASRAEHIYTKIVPHLRRGAIVISDRFSDSSFAYQGFARKMTIDVLELERFVQRGFKPDFTLFFNVEVEESLRRVMTRTDKPDRFDLEQESFRRAVHAGYQARFRDNQDRMVEIDAMKSPDDVIEQVRLWVRTNFKKREKE